MYLDYFGLRSDPFRLDPNLDFVYVSKSHEETLAHLVYGIEQGEDFVLITGGIGTGKTLALHFLLDQIVSSFRTAFVNVTTISFLELLKLILDDLEVEFERSWDRADLLAALKHFLGIARKQREKVLVVVDEAQNLDPETLEGLRLLSNLSQPGDQVLQIILVGQPTLLSLVDLPELEQLKQRIRVHYELEELSREEVEEYILHRMKVSGGDGSVFSKSAIERINRFSRGVPRLVNQFAGKALLSAYVDDSKAVRGPHVELEETEQADLDQEGEGKDRIAVGPENEPTPDDHNKVLKSSLPRPAGSTEAHSPSQSSREPQPLVREALSSIEDVDLDAVRDSRRPHMASPYSDDESERKAGTGRIRIGAACLLVVIAASLYFTGAWQWLTDSLGGTQEVSSSLASEEGASAVQGPALSHAEPPVSADPVQEGLASSETDRLEEIEDPVTATKPHVNDEASDNLIAEPAVSPAGNNTDPRTLPEAAPAVQPKVLHVASFRVESQAISLIEKFRAQGVEGLINEKTVNGTTWYRIYLGPFPDAATATRVGQELKDQNAVTYYRLLDGIK
jgi:general secretion pathway protein A